MREVYTISEQGKNNLKKCKTKYYADVFGIASDYASSLLNGVKCRTITAKAMISVCYGISLDDKRMEELMEENFNKLKEE